MLVLERNEHEFTKEEQRRFIDSLDLFEISEKNIHKGEFCIDKGIIKYTGQIVAMKRALTEDSYKSLVNEFKTLCKLSHPAVQSLVGFYPNPDYKKAVLITPFYINGTLRNIINSPPSEWNLLTKTMIIFGIATGLKYLHEKGIIHHDLKVDNILIDDNFHPIIAGFGDSHKNPQGELMSTLPYIAPEVLSGGQYTPKTDVYSFGLLVNEIFSGSPPYKGLSIQQINENIADGNPPQIASGIPNLFKKIFMKCIKKDPSERPKSKDIFKKIKNGLDDLKVNRSVLDTYKNQLLDSALCPLNNFIIPTPLIELPGKQHPWNEKGSYPILLDVFESVLKKAGDRSIVLVMLFGPYQSGKSTFLRTLTGNAAFYAGKGIKSQTQGILIDGPYIVSDLINRLDDDYCQLKEKCNSLDIDKDTAIFFIDSQGIGDEDYELNLKPVLDKVNAVFTSITTICLTVSNFNDKVDDMKTILTTIRRAQLSSSFPLSKVYFLVKKYRDLDNVLDYMDPEKYKENISVFTKLWWNEHNIAKNLYRPDSLMPLPLGDVEHNYPGYVNTVYQSLYYILSSIPKVKFEPSQYIQALTYSSYPLFDPYFMNFMNLVLKFENKKIPNTLESSLRHCCACCMLLNTVIIIEMNSNFESENPEDIIKKLEILISLYVNIILPYILGNDEIPFFDFNQYVWEIKSDMCSYVNANKAKWQSIMSQQKFLTNKKWHITGAYVAIATAIAYIPVIGDIALFAFAGSYVLGMKLESNNIMAVYRKLENDLTTTFYPYIWERSIRERKFSVIDMNRFTKRLVKSDQPLYVFYDQPNHDSTLLFQSLTGIKLDAKDDKYMILHENVTTSKVITRFERYAKKRTTTLPSQISFIYAKGINEEELRKIESTQGVNTIFITSFKEGERLTVLPKNVQMLNAFILSENYFHWGVNKLFYKKEMWRVNNYYNGINRKSVQFLPIHASDYQFDKYGPRCVTSIKYGCRYILKDPNLVLESDEISEFETNTLKYEPNK